jgi:uncharacterized PurR-regulated membrane protein YhhQ (DUF165 family)
MNANGTMDDAQQRRFMMLAVFGMALVVLASNILVQYPIQAFGLADWLTYGAFSYPFAFLVTDLSNRHLGAARTRRVVYVGFVLAVLLSLWLATPRIAVASGVAFLAAQLTDVGLFAALRRRAWWVAPFASSVISGALDTVLFFGIAFHCGDVAGFGTLEAGFARFGLDGACQDLPWVNLALADYGVKLFMAALCVVPYGLALRLAPSHGLRGA